MGAGAVGKLQEQCISMGTYREGPSTDRAPAPVVHQRSCRETLCRRPPEGLPGAGGYVCGRTAAHRVLWQNVLYKSGISALGRPKNLSARAPRTDEGAIRCRATTGGPVAADAAKMDTGRNIKFTTQIVVSCRQPHVGRWGV